ncbi:MAG: hypothetical protein M1162_02480 [Candidatus Thermoplasmatota archaeon]|nr:hypothetical protein [Candidatus Thermoplasmatota archaeon]
MRVKTVLTILGVTLIVFSMIGAMPHTKINNTVQKLNIPDAGTGVDVLLVHGYGVGDTSGSPGSSPFTGGVNLYQQLVSEGYNVGLVSYYGTFTVAFSNGTTYTDSSFFGTANTPIQDISVEMAKLVQYMTSSGPITMDIVSHSMGGLIVLYMLENYQFNNLNLKNLIFVGSPFAGSPFASVASYLDLGWIVGSEAYQMQPGSSFITSLLNNEGHAYSNFPGAVISVYAGNYDPWWGYFFFSGDNDGVVSVSSASHIQYSHIYYFNDIHTSSLDWLTWSGIGYFEDQSLANTVINNLAGNY